MAGQFQMEIAAMAQTQSLSFLPRNAHSVPFVELRQALAALANAVVHGTGENSCKRVYVSCRCYMDGEVSITVRDQGKGFDSSALMDPSSPENLLCTHGRGIYLMKALMDEVCFEEGGTVVTMRKKSNASSAEQRQAPLTSVGSHER
jgi:anti-sigma regulatory factor (Ser/Thr protein kinase)